MEINNDKKEQHKKLLIQEMEYDTPYHWAQVRNFGRVSELRTKVVLALAGDVSAKNILDFGCGDGYFSSIACGNNTAYVAGVDISERAVQFAREMVPRAHFFALKEPPLHFEDHFFDVVFCLDVIEHIPNDEIAAWVKEIHRVIRPGGKLVISVPSKVSILTAKHFRHYTPEELRHDLSMYFDYFNFQGYFSRLPVIPVSWFNQIYNRRYIWKLFGFLMKECTLKNAFYFACSCTPK